MLITKDDISGLTTKIFEVLFESMTKSQLNDRVLTEKFPASEEIAEIFLHSEGKSGQ